MNKYFFMALINATQQGRPVVQFNTVSSLNSPNLNAASIGAIQEGAANMAREQGTQFDDLVIQNLFLLTPDGMTEEQFVAGTALSQQPQAEPDHQHEQEALVDLTAEEQAEVQALASEDTITAQRDAVVVNFRSQVQDAANEAVAEDIAKADEN